MSSSLSCQHSTQHSDDIMCTNSKTHPQTQHSFGKLHLLPRWKMLWRHIGENGDPEADFFFLRGDTSSVELWAYRWTTNRFGWCSDVPVELWPKSYRYQVVKAWHFLLFSEFESHRNRFFCFFLGNIIHLNNISVRIFVDHLFYSSPIFVLSRASWRRTRYLLFKSAMALKGYYRL